ncbi:hypothetical protein IGI04_034312 [Brassica rapa subsp. trilocularis]|uniref:Uncharacterized protein n=2 Tax=Brassica campestris TaxID=3711 RepID=M4EG95_BRACM|nr:uncharacterized protein LOC103838077 [Brassica rapa]KAG5382842.1 hypothetical protein IGI04_034312 [Brassica rapa subsp. trilocularis]
MAETESPELNCVYVDTNLGTHLLILVDNHETVSDFKEKLCKEHHQCFPKFGEISVYAVKVERQNTRGLLFDYHLPDSMYLSMAFEGVSHNCWFVSVEAAVSVVDKAELMDADDKCSDLEKNKEIAADSLALDGYNKNQSLEQDLGAEKTTKKRKHGGKIGKKPSADPNDEKNKATASDSLLFEGYTKNQTPGEDLETPVVEKTRKKRKLNTLDGESSLKKPVVDVSQSPAAARTDVDGSHELCGNVASESSPREKLDDILTEATGKEIEMGEKSVEDLEGDKTENNDLVSHPENILDTTSGLTARPDTEKKKKRKKRSEDDINQSSAAATVSEINELPANVDHVDATPESLLISRGNPLAEASQLENDMAENSVDDVAKDKTETDNLESHTAIHLDSNNFEKETEKISNDDINQSSSAAVAAATIITSGDVVNQINEVHANVDLVDATPESLPISRGENLDIHFAEASQKENEMVEKSVEDVGRDNTETDNIASRLENLLETNSGLTPRPDTEKKKKRKKRSKDDINQSSAAIITSMDIVNEINGVPANVDPVDATPASLPMTGGTFAESSQKGDEMVKKTDDDVGSGKAIPSAAENIQTENVEMDDADDAKSVKTTKKKKSKRTKTPAKEDTMFASGAQNVESIEAVDGEGTDNVIRNVLDSLQENDETAENVDTTVKKSSKKSKKKNSSKVVESQVLPVEINNAALEETPLINNPKDTDALFTPVEKDAESDASLLKKSSEIAEDNSLSKKSPIGKVDMGDNFGCSPNKEKQDQVAGGAKSKKEKKKKGLDLHPSGSIAGSLNSVRPKEKKSRGQQPASSGASHLQSRVKSVRSGSVKATVSSKKQEVKKSSKPVVAVDKRKTNFFENAEKCNSSEDEYKKTSDVSSKTPSDYSSDNDSDVTSMSRKQQGNNLAGGANKFEGSLQDLLRRSSSYKKALIRAQSQPDIDDDSPVDCVPDSQGL